MKKTFFDNIKAFAEPKKADPSAERKKQIRSRELNINMKTIGIIFGIVIFLLAAVSIGVVITEKSKDKDPGITNEDLTNCQTAIINSFPEENTGIFCNILLALTNDDNKGLHFLSLLRIDSENEKVSLSFIPTDAKANIASFDGTLLEHFEDGGMTGLIMAVENNIKLKIDRYLYCDEKDFMNIMKYIGETEITLEDDIDHEYNGINFIIEKGTHSLTADNMLKYCIYLCDDLQIHMNTLTELFSLFAKKIIISDNAEETQKNYNRIVNYVTTDISAMDMSDNMLKILELSQKTNCVISCEELTVE